MASNEELQVDNTQNGTSPGEPELQTTSRSIKLAKSPSRRRRSNDPQKSARVLIKRSSFKGVNNLTRMSGVKFKNPLVRKSSGGTQLNQLNKLNSPNFLKETCCSIDKKMKFHDSPRSSESSNSTPNSAHKSARLSRSNSKTRVIRKQSLSADLGVQRATCSSALKHLKSPAEVKDLHEEGSESDGVSVIKPCPFTYCSLHGHRHANVPPLNTLISIRRRLLKTQKGTKQGTRSPLRVKKSGKIKEEEMNQMGSIGHDEVYKETCSKEDEDNCDLSSISQKLFGEDSEESLQETSEIATIEQHALVLPSSLGDLCPEGCCIGTTSQVTSTDIDEEKCAASCQNEGELNRSSPKSIPESGDTQLCEETSLELKEDGSTSSEIDKPVEESLDRGNMNSDVESSNGERGKLNTKKDGAESDLLEEIVVPLSPIRYLEVPMAGRERSIGEGTTAKSDDFTCSDKLNSSSPKPTPDNVESGDCTTAKLPQEVVESTSDNGRHEDNCASGCEAPEEQITAIEQTNRSLVTKKHGSVELDKNESAESGMQAKNHKYITMWKLMYKHAVTANTADVGKPLPLHGEHKESQVKGASGVLETDNSSFPERDEHTASTNHSAGDENLEVCQQNAIDLVQEAFDKILLPEVLDNSCDDQSITNGRNSDQEGLQLRNEGGEHRALISGDISEDRMVQNAGESQSEAENCDAPKEKAMNAVEDKLELNTPKRWSSLKKFILLKRFIKAIEKVKNLSYRKPHYRPLDPNPEAETINLRQQDIKDKRSADEWMVDYALQKVISKLPPAQQRKVALIVEAFETVLPFPDIRTQQRSKADLQSCNSLLIQNADETGKERDSGTSAKILFGSISCPEENLSKCADKFIDHKMDQQQSPVKSPMLKESIAEDYFTKTEVDIPASGATDEDQQITHVSIKTSDGEDIVCSTNNDAEFPNVSSSECEDLQFSEETSLEQEEDGSTSYEIVENKPVEEIAAEHISVSSLDRGDMNSNVENSNGETGGLNTNRNGAESDLCEEMVVPLALRRYYQVPTVARERSNGEGTTVKSGFFQGIPPPEESHSESNAVVTNITQLEKQNYTRLWYFVYKHMVSSTAEKDGDETHDGADQEKGNNADNNKNELRRIETVKLVEKAIDEILLPGNQDESEDDQSNAGDLISDDEPPENKVGIEGKSFATFSNIAKDSFRESNKKAREDPEQIVLKSDNAVIEDEQKEVLKVEEKPKQKMSKNWRNLKRMILLNRFIKALERGKKSNPRGPKVLLLEPDPEVEKVNLKPQSMDERKNAEEWMLDYALQKAVAKLTPARNRKVALLVEAFETVIPNNGIPNPFKPVVIC